MDLFLSAGIELEERGRGGGRHGRSTRARRIPLLKPSVVHKALGGVRALDEDVIAAAEAYAQKVRSPKFAAQKETAVRNLFVAEILGAVLGYRTFDPDNPYTLAFEHPIRSGAVDVGLGRFSADGGGELVAPFELKGPGTTDLDAIMAGRGRSPVQQAWDYAIDAPGSRWVLVSNCIEIRLYGFGRGREAYEVFDLRRLDQPEELARLWLLLSAGRLLEGATERLLRDSDAAYKDITGELYVQYSDLRKKLIQFLIDSADGPRLKPLNAIEVAQKLLDRVLFIAFAERTDLLPDRLLDRAAKARNEFAPQPVWRNFLVLFRHVDEGDEGLAISGYNGGLFALDTTTDAIVLPDDLATDFARLAEWDYGTDVPVTILGHIFEQSITDIERLRAESQGLPPPVVSRRKRHGIIYTPDIITRFLVERTIGTTLGRTFRSLLGEHAGIAAIPSKGDSIPWPSDDAERDFWRDYLTALRDLKIVDPACGSGAFLVAAFDLLAAEYRRVIARLAALGEVIEFDLFDEILSQNLYGVDLNAESVEITRLSLWLKTARREHRLQNLEATIKVGNSLIDDPAYTDRPFDWEAAFPEVFAKGRFDIVVGNPPYVRMGLLTPFKPYLEKHYVVASDRADLYAYFFERGVKLLKDGGRLGFISSSTFFRTGSGENLRTFLGDGVAIETVIDFGDLQIFEGVTTYPAIVTLRKGGSGSEGELSFLKVDKELPKDLDAAFDARAGTMPRSRLTAGSWRFEDDALAALREKIAAGRKTLGEVYGPPLYGIKTGFNAAFIVDTETRDRLVAADPKSQELLKPFLRGENIKRWRVESEGLFLINTPKGKVDIEAYPAIRDWLRPFKPELEERATKQEWFELQQAQVAYQPKFSTDKIIYGHFAQDRIFAFDRSGFFSNDKSYFIPNAGLDLLSLLNSLVAWSFITSISPAVRGGFHEMRVQYLERVPIPAMQKSTRARLAELGDTCTRSATERFEIQTAVRQRLPDLARPGRAAKLTSRLHNWWDLDFAGFRKEIKRVFKDDIPVRERREWEDYLSENTAKVRSLTAEIEAAEGEIDEIVFRLFDLTSDEIKLLQDSMPR